MKYISEPDHDEWSEGITDNTLNPEKNREKTWNRIQNNHTQWEDNGISWTAKITRIDINTGEILTRKDAEDNTKYILIKTTKNETIFHAITKATINFTKQYRKQPQQRLFN